jgi:hypothetical protein
MFNSYRRSSIYNSDIIPEDQYDAAVKLILDQVPTGGPSARLKTVVGAAIKLGLDNNMEQEDFDALMDVAKAIFKHKSLQRVVNDCKSGRPG